MSVPINKNTDNHNSPLQMPPQSPVEEKKWRCTKMTKGGNESLRVSPELIISEDGILSRLSENEEVIPKTCTTKISSTHPRFCRFFVRLAEESPKRNSAEYSDSSTYDSFNCRETDICHDSSDTDSNSSSSSNHISTIKVVEYEVASASNSDDLFTNDSSSGTDDMVIAAVASVICTSPRISSDFADTEEVSSDTDSKHDPEMTSADYWMCLKCRNKNNNPMFRYCEKCYQIRKNHFPPRPRLRKSRSAMKQRKFIGLSSLQRAATTSLIEESLQRRRQNESEKKELRHNSLSPPSSKSMQKDSLYSFGRLYGISQQQTRNSAESSTDDDDTSSKFYKCMNNTSKGIDVKMTQCGSHSSSSSAIKKLNGQKSPQNLQMTSKRKLSTATQSTNETIFKKIRLDQDIISPLLPSETENETDFALSQTCGSSTQGTQKDSGFSSAPSSQERKSSSDQLNDDYEDCISHPGIRDDSSDTVCDELNDSDVAEILEDKYISLDTNTCPRVQKPKREISDSRFPSISDPKPALPLLQSISDCSDTYSSIASPSNPDSLNVSFANQADKLDRNFGDIARYGSCMTCLTEPKNGVFVHSRFLHLCCCYKCAMKIWNKNKKCPVCNCVVKNVMKLFVH